MVFSQQQNIRNLSLCELQNYFAEIGEKKFRAKQVYEWLWQKHEGSFDGMLSKRTFNIVWITKDKPVALNFDASNKSVSYKGDEVSVKMK